MATEKLSDKESHEFLNILKKRIEKNRFQNSKSYFGN